MKSNIDSENIFRYLRKLYNDEADKLLSNLGEYDPLPDGYVTDGKGNIYKIPNKGATPLYSIEGDDYFKYRYNWETKEIEAYAIIEPRDDVNNYDFVDSYGLGASNYIDNPTYWTYVFAKTIEDLANAEINENIGPFGEYNFEDKDIYEYMIKANINLILDNDDYDNLSDYEEEYSEYIKTLSKKETLYTEPLEINCSFSGSTNTVYIKVEFTMPMTKEDLMDIWDEYSDLIYPIGENLEYHIELEDLDMVEV